MGVGCYPLNYMLPPFANSGPNGTLVTERSECFGSGHLNGANFVFCDGSVHFVSNGINNAAAVASNDPRADLLF